MTSKLTEFLAEKSKHPDFTSAEKRKQIWLGSIGDLYQSIESWLAEARASGAISDLRKGGISVNEERLGTYEAPKLSFDVGSVTISFEPRGTFVVGAQGRVDIRASTGRSVPAIIVDNGWHYVDQRTHQHPPITEAALLQILEYLLQR